MDRVKHRDQQRMAGWTRLATAVVLDTEPTHRIGPVYFKLAKTTSRTDREIAPGDARAHPELDLSDSQDAGPCEGSDIKLTGYPQTS